MRQMRMARSRLTRETQIACPMVGLFGRANPSFLFTLYPALNLRCYFRVYFYSSPPLCVRRVISKVNPTNGNDEVGL